MPYDKPKYSKIIHVDMDAFFASVEQLDNPELRGQPIVVGSPGKRGVIAAASYEARQFGVRSAMPGAVARRKCPHLIFVHGHYERYREISNHVMEIFRDYTDLVEPMSLDEAYMDVTSNKKNMPSATNIAIEIRKRIKQDTGLTASAGVSINKFLAKIASDYNKPDGIKVIPPGKTIEFIDTLDVRRIPGVGKVTEQKMKHLGINTCRQLRQYSKFDLIAMFGKPGHYYYQVLRDEYNPPVMPQRTRKSMGAERTFIDDIQGEEEIINELDKVLEKLKKRLNKSGVTGRTITVKFRYFDFETHTRSRTYDFFVHPENDLRRLTHELLATPIMPNRPVRLLGVSVSTLNNEPENDSGQLTLGF